jgi:hypothetical protein
MLCNARIEATILRERFCYVLGNNVRGNMLRLKVKRLREGQHPSELVVSLTTADGQQEEMVVDERALQDDTIDIGYPVGSDERNRLLIELPRETLRGLWRVWVGQDAVTKGAAA